MSRTRSPVVTGLTVHIHHDQTKFLADKPGAQWRPMAAFHPANGDRTSVVRGQPVQATNVDAVDGCAVPKQYVFRLGHGDGRGYRYHTLSVPAGGQFTSAQSIQLGDLSRFFRPRTN